MKQKWLSLLCIAALLTAILCGCGATASTESQSAYDAASKAEPMDMPMVEYSYAGGMTNDTTVSTEEAGTETAVTEPLQITAEKIIYTANVQLETMEFDTTVAAVEKSVTDIGGFVEYSDVSGDSTYLDDGSVHIRNRRAFYTVRVPAEKLDAFLQQAGTIGNVIGSSKSAQNVTSQYTDFEARKASLVAQETRLLELVAAAEDIDALITLESKLAEVRYEIESFQRELNNLDSRITYSTVDLSVREVEVYQPTPTVQRNLWQRMGDAFVRGWKSFVRGLGNLLVSISGNFFTLVVVVIIAVVGFFMGRKIIRKKKAKKNTED